MPQFLGFQASVVVDGAELPEYSIQISEEESEISCYIPSEVEKNFAVRWKDSNLQRNTVGQLYLDGIRAGRKRIVKGQDGHEAERCYYRVSPEMVRPLCFARLSLTDDENCATLADSKLGEIRLKIYPLLHFRDVPLAPDWKNSQVLGDMSLHERSKKAMIHRVGYGDDTKNVKRMVMSDVVRGKRLVTFLFHYRAFDILQANGIVPLPRPGPSTKREKKRARCKEEETETVKLEDGGEADNTRLKMLKAEISEIETRLLKRQKTTIKSEYNEVMI